MKFDDFDWLYAGLGREELQERWFNGEFNESQIWTEVKTEDGVSYIVTGKHYVANAISYWVSKQTPETYSEVKSTKR